MKPLASATGGAGAPRSVWVEVTESDIGMNYAAVWTARLWRALLKPLASVTGGAVAPRSVGIRSYKVSLRNKNPNKTPVAAPPRCAVELTSGTIQSKIICSTTICIIAEA